MKGCLSGTSCERYVIVARAQSNIVQPVVREAKVSVELQFALSLSLPVVLSCTVLRLLALSGCNEGPGDQGTA